MKVYVAGRTNEVDRVRGVQAGLKSLGNTITFDWTGPEGAIKTDWSQDRPKAASLSAREQRAVVNADALVLLWSRKEKDYGVGCLLETGMALANHKLVVISGATRESVFWYLPNVKRVAWDSDIYRFFPKVEPDPPCTGSGYAHKPHGNCPGYSTDRT